MAYKVGHFLLDIKASQHGITNIHFLENTSEQICDHSDNPIIEQGLQEITQFISKQIIQFSVPIDLQEGTSFQQDVWLALQNIPYGTTCSYKDIGQKINRPRAYQAIGQACKNNPVPIIIPCHRVISQSGKLTGYFGSSDFGLSIKQSLLTLEKGNQN